MTPAFRGRTQKGLSCVILLLTRGLLGAAPGTAGGHSPGILLRPPLEQGRWVWRREFPRCRRRIWTQVTKTLLGFLPDEVWLEKWKWFHFHFPCSQGNSAFFVCAWVCVSVCACSLPSIEHPHMHTSTHRHAHTHACTLVHEVHTLLQNNFWIKNSSPLNLL